MTDAADAPWGVADVRSMFFTTLAGIGALLVSWWGVDGTSKLDRQVTWLVVAVAGVIMVGAGNFFWLLAGRRTVRLRRDAVLARLETTVGAPLHDDVDAGVSGTVWVTRTGSALVHRRDCLTVRGKPVERITDADAALLQHCEMCQP